MIIVTMLTAWVLVFGTGVFIHNTVVNIRPLWESAKDNAWKGYWMDRLVEEVITAAFMVGIYLFSWVIWAKYLLMRSE